MTAKATLSKIRATYDISPLFVRPDTLQKRRISSIAWDHVSGPRHPTPGTFVPMAQAEVHALRAVLRR
jgi:hypothetical protein